MKIEFVNGQYVTDGKNTVYSQLLHGFATGYFEVKTPKYSWWNFQRTKVETKIVIVKQKSTLSMVRTLGHELMHAFVYIFLTKTKYNKYNDWIDRKQKKERR